jgi:hypothetical protein
VLALVFSALLTVYIVIPEAIFRFFFGFHISARSFVLTRTETAYRAVLVAFLPFWIALLLAWYVPGPNHWPFPVRENSIQQRRMDYKIVASALYSEAEYSSLRRSFWIAFTRCSRRQARLASWYFLLIAIEAIFAGRFAAGYARNEKNRIRRWLRDRFLAPYISHWPPLLDIGQVQADILSADGILYQGTVSQYFIKNDGELSGIILHEPRRFNKERYRKDRDEGKEPKKEAYWTDIPSQNLYFFADKILNMNLTYVTDIRKIPSLAAADDYLARELRELTLRVGKLRISVLEPKAPPSSPHEKKADSPNK